LAEVRAARADGVDVTTEVLPYNAGSALISSAVFGRNWQEIFAITYRDVEWAATGERFTKETWEKRRAEDPDGQVIHHYMKEEWTRRALVEPNLIVVSDLLPMQSQNKKVAPHSGTFTKILGKYVRDEKILDLMTAIKKMTILPAQRMEKFAPAFKNKGRLQVGADADITIFDASTILDKATYKKPYQKPLGVEYVIVSGTPVIENGQLPPNTYPGQRIQAQ
jgi:N-acyl-D-aspartate/D-glutamate deacylase